MRRLLLAAALLAPTGAAAFPFGPLAPADEVESITAEMDLPTVHAPVAPHLSKVRYPAAALKAYAADVPLAEVRKSENAEKYRFRREVFAAFELLRDGWANDGRQLRPALPAEITDRTKLDLRREQNGIAALAPQLDLLEVRLRQCEPMREREPKRWQAHYDYVRAELLCRMALMQEYNQLLGRARTEDVPPLDPARHVGYRLRQTDRVANGLRIQHREARERLEAVVSDHPNTPWAVAASRVLRQPPGLAWEPAPRP